MSGKRGGASDFPLVMFLMSNGCYCSMSLIYGAMVWSAVFDCCISSHAHLLFEII